MSSTVTCPLRSRANGSSPAARSRSTAAASSAPAGQHLDPPVAADHRLLQRLGARLHRRRRGDVDARGEHGVSRSGRSLEHRCALDEVGVEVLRPRLGARGQGQPEVQPGSRREPLRVHEREVGPAQRPLPDAGQVAVAGEADLAELREAQPHPHQEPADAPAMGRAVMATGTSPPVDEVLAGALAPTGGRDRGGDDVLDAEAGAGAAVVAGRPAAVLEADLGQGVAPVLPQEVLVEAGRDVVPREHLVLGAVAVDDLLEAEPVALEGLEPEVEVEVLGPLLEAAAPPPDLLDHRAEPPVATGGDALGRGRLRVVPLELDAPVAAQLVSEEVHLAGELLPRVLTEPLERRERLGHEPADRHGDRRVLVVLPADLDAVPGERGDAERVLVGLGGQPGEEVELHPPPALAEGRIDRFVQVLLADELVDDLPHAPGAGLGGEGEPGAAAPADLAGDAHPERVDPERRQRHRDVVAPGRVHDPADDVLDAGEVRGGQAT